MQNNQFVHKGDKLVQIDAADYKLKLAKSDAEIIQATEQLAVANEQVSVARSNLIKSRSTLQNATIMSDRYVKLYNERAGSL